MRSKKNARLVLLLAILVLAAAAGACSPATDQTSSSQQKEHQDEHRQADFGPVELGAGEKLKVVATTSIVGDVVANVGGDRIELTTLMDIGMDPHTYVATPSDRAAIHDAQVVFASGAGLEEELEEVFDTAASSARYVEVSQGIEFLAPPGNDELPAAQPDEHLHGDVDPHVWFSVPNVKHWVETIEHALSNLDPQNSAYYEESATAYASELDKLDEWVREQIGQIPEANRKLVTNHPTFGYLADSYGLEQLGAVYPISPSSEPSAQDIAALQDIIHQYGVPAIFTESTVNPKLAQQVAEDTDVKLVPLYSGSLSEQGQGAGTYIMLIRYDVAAIVDALQ